jgi:hypothetical protein
LGTRLGLNSSETYNASLVVRALREHQLHDDGSAYEPSFGGAQRITLTAAEKLQAELRDRAPQLDGTPGSLLDPAETTGLIIALDWATHASALDSRLLSATDFAALGERAASLSTPISSMMGEAHVAGRKLLAANRLGDVIRLRQLPPSLGRNYTIFQGPETGGASAITLAMDSSLLVAPVDTLPPMQDLAA